MEQHSCVSHIMYVSPFICLTEYEILRETNADGLFGSDVRRHLMKRMAYLDGKFAGPTGAHLFFRLIYSTFWCVRRLLGY